jgi:hypothetical protein
MRIPFEPLSKLVNQRSLVARATFSAKLSKKPEHKGDVFESIAVQLRAAGIDPEALICDGDNCDLRVLEVYILRAIEEKKPVSQLIREDQLRAQMNQWWKEEEE